MLKQFVAIKGTGLFHDAGSSPPLGRVSLIFGENGRGKSTLASVLRSCSDDQGTALSARKTLDGSLAQSIDLLFIDATGANNLVQLAASTWSAPMPHLRVFDAEFVSRNVYAGTAISTDQRASLLEFALGEQAVTLRQKVDIAAAKLTEATTNITTHTAAIRAGTANMSVEAFSALAVAPTADHEIATLEKRIAAAVSREELLKKTSPVQLPFPTFDATSLFAILTKSLPEVEATAENAVRVQLGKCTHQGFEQWIAQGSAYVIGNDCPYCGASIEGNVLIGAYRTHFNKAYEALKAESANLEAQIPRRLGDAIVDTLVRHIETAQAHIDGWKSFIDLPSISFDAGAMKTELAKMRALIEPLAASKARQPLEPFGSASELAQVTALWASASSFVTASNKEIVSVAAAIEGFRKSLIAEDVPALRAGIEVLKLRKLRHTAPVVTALDQLSELHKAKKARSEEKDASRKALDALMTGMLNAYQTKINAMLGEFGAQITIENFGFDYRGASGLPRSDYRLKVRGQEVKLAGDGTAAFGNALSEGDKRSLAFALFLANLHQDPQIAERIVVIDDPMCSLDRHRRTATIRALKVLAPKCKQLIVLAHDAYFLQAIDDELRGAPLAKPAGALTYCKIVPAANDYSAFGPLDLAKECITQYEKDLALIMSYADAIPGIDRDHAATRLRVLLEANLHRQFPSLIPRAKMLGQVITVIESAVAPHPLAALHPYVAELRALNDYAKTFHHAEDGMSPDFAGIDEGELRQFCRRALVFVLRG